MQRIFKPNWLYILLIVLQIPVIWYSLNTAFSLNEEYAGCLTSSLERWNSWITGQFFTFGKESGQFRPMEWFHFTLTWQLFGLNYTLHHAWMLLVKLITIFFSYKILALFDTDEKRSFSVSFFVFVCIYSFFPNNPEARLSVTEPYVVLVLSIITYYVARLIFFYEGNLQRSRGDYFIILFAYLLLAWSKEFSIVFVFSFLCLLVLFNFNKQNFLKLLPFIAIFVHTFLKVYWQSQELEYGAPQRTLSGMKDMFIQYTSSIFLWDTSIILLFGFFGMCLFYFTQMLKTKHLEHSDDKSFSNCMDCIRHKLHVLLFSNKEFVLYLFVLCNFLLFLFSTSTFWVFSVRYFYPLVYLLSLIVGWSAIAFQRSKYFKTLSTLSVIFCFYFIFVNYYNFVYQYATRYAFGNAAESLISDITTLFEEKQHIYLPQDVYLEGESKLALYFSSCAPQFHEEHYNFLGQESIKTISPEEDIYRPAIFDNPGNFVGYKIYKTYSPLPASKLFFLQAARKLSSFLQLTNSPFYWIDAGSGSISPEIAFFLLKKVSREDLDVIQQVHTLYNNSDPFHVLNTAVAQVPGEQYAEQLINLPEDLKWGHTYVISMEYQTLGQAKPKVTIFQTPFVPNKVPFDEWLVPSDILTTTQKVFPMLMNTPDPVLIFRNWSDKGEFIIKKVKLQELER